MWTNGPVNIRYLLILPVFVFNVAIIRWCKSCYLPELYRQMIWATGHLAGNCSALTSCRSQIDAKKLTKKRLPILSVSLRDPAGTRTQGPNIKSVVLYQLSYEINLSKSIDNVYFFGSAKIQSQSFCAKSF